MWVVTLAKNGYKDLDLGVFGQKMYPSDWPGVGAEGRHLEGTSDQCRTSVHRASALLSRGVQDLGIIQRTMEWVVEPTGRTRTTRNIHRSKRITHEMKVTPSQK